MKKQLYTEEQIIGAIKSHEAGEKAPDLCRRSSLYQPPIAQLPFEIPS